MDKIQYKNFKAENLITYRSEMTPIELQLRLSMIYKYIYENDAKKINSLITITNSIDKKTKASDTEILLPINKEIPSSMGYLFVETFYFNNAIMIRHKGNPANILNTYLTLMQEAIIAGHKLIPPLCQVYIFEPENEEDLDDFEIEIYAKIK